jgi:hypothetical protein
MKWVSYTISAKVTRHIYDYSQANQKSPKIIFAPFRFLSQKIPKNGRKESTRQQHPAMMTTTTTEVVDQMGGGPSDNDAQRRIEIRFLFSFSAK